MSDFTKRYIIAVTLLSIIALITFGAYSTRDNAGVLYAQDVPMIVGDWYGRDIPMDERTYEILETKDTFMREYVNSSGGKVILAVVCAANNRKVAHPPEVCFAGGGWSRNSKDIQTVRAGSKTVKANRLILQKDTEKQVALYLYKAGEKLTPNYYLQQFNIILNGMLHKNVSSALIRISAHSVGDDVEDATERVRKFAGQVIPILEEYLP